jgi:hypothetical protein
VLARIGGGKWVDETVALAREGFDVGGTFGVVGEGGADLADAEVDAAVEIDEVVVTPKRALDLVAADRFTGAFDQQEQNAEGLRVELEGDAGFA